MVLRFLAFSCVCCYPSCCGLWRLGRCMQLAVFSFHLSGFVFLTADTLVQDTSSNWSWLVLPRTNSRAALVDAKVLSLFMVQDFSDRYI